MKSVLSIILVSCIACSISGCVVYPVNPNTAKTIEKHPLPGDNTQPTSAKSAAQTEQSKSIPDRLKKLKELKDSGAITDEEYEAQRKVLVEQL